MSETTRVNLQLPDYRIERELGRGAMAKVYLAVHLGLQRHVALKIMSPALVSNPTFRERFQREAQFVAQLDHPNIVTVFDIGVHEDNYYMAMRYIAGGVTLKDRISEGLDEAGALAVMRQIAGALHAAHSHERRIVHRDVKPANILFDPNGNAVLSDFGIAKSTGGSRPGVSDDGYFEDSNDALTMAGQAVGTPAYMSPDQILDRPLDARSDLYSLGVVFFEMLTGRKPFHAEESIALAMMHVNEPIPRLPKPLRKYQPVVDRLMAKKPEKRFASAVELIEALDRIAPPAGGGFNAAGTGQTGVPAAVAVDTLTRTALLEDRPARWPRWLLAGGVLVAAVGLTLRYGSALLTPSELPCTPAALTEPQRQAVAQLIEIADMNREFGRLVFPDVSNAAYGYDQVLELDPCHPQARQSMRELPELLAVQVAQAGESTDPEERAMQRPLIKEGLIWWPQHPTLLGLSEKLSADDD